jgi:hypothetical protein
MVAGEAMGNWRLRKSTPKAFAITPGLVNNVGGVG